MKTKNSYFIFADAFYRCLLFAATVVAVGGPSATANDARPNVVMIVTDNHGAWTLGCYGNKDIRSPNIDRLASEGTLFTRAFASNPVCSPTRATLLTGLLPSQHGVHCFLRGGRLQIGPEARNTLAELTSLPEVLKDAGYKCGLVGKWHLGDNLHPQEGMDDYWITMPHGGTSTFYDAQIIENGKLRNEPKYLTDLWTEHAVNFIEQNKGDKRPFFLLLSYNGPYSLGRLLLREGRNRHAEFYADKELPSFPREATHPWQYNNRDYINNPVSLRRVATEVSGVDDGVGTVMATLKKNGLDANTLVIFVADQGWVGGHGGFFGMGDHTRPLTARDGMMQIPMIWRQPGRVPAGKQSDLMVANYDVMPTLLSYLGLADKMPAKPNSPGRDFANVVDSLRESNDRSRSERTTLKWDNAVFYEFENLRCIRTENWKYIHRHSNGPHELYDLKDDPTEQVNLVADADCAETRKTLKQRLDAFYAQYAEPRYDLWNGGGSQTVIFEGIDEEIAQVEAVEPPQLDAEFQQADIQVPDGFTVEVAAGPPLVKHPMMACFDDRGRLYIAESAGLNLRSKELEEQLPNFIRLLEDRDGDGRFDRSTIFADKMTLPQGALWHDGALYVASPPNIWRMEDTDNDGVADKREVLVNEFGYTGNAASIHGCFLGPNGRIYWCDGRHGHEFRDKFGNVTSKREGSYIFSCEPDGSDVQIHCGGGMDNPVEIDFTEEGEMLGTVNILYSRPRVDCLVHWLHGGAYPHSERVLGELKRTGDLLGPVHKFGHVAVSGTTRYRSGVLERNFRDNFFVTIFNTGKVQRLELEREGSSFCATEREFLSCRTPDFHPTDVLEDADGSLLVIDTGGWFRIGCPTSQIAKPNVTGGIYRIRRKGMTPLADPWGAKIDWQKLSDAQLVRLLNDTRFKVREKAVAVCAKRGEDRNSIIAALRTAVQRGDSRQRRNAVWALTRIHSRDAKAVVREALSDPSESVRLAACHSVATRKDDRAQEKLERLLRDDTPPIRREAATALGRIRKGTSAIFDALRRDDIDRSEEHALIYALIEIDNVTIEKGFSDKDARVQRAALIVLDQTDHGRLNMDEVIGLLNSDNEQLRVSVVDVISRRPPGQVAAADQLTNWLSDFYRESRESRRETPQSRRNSYELLIRGLASRYLGTPDVDAVIARVLSEKKTPAVTRSLVLSVIADAHSKKLNPAIAARLRKYLKSTDAELVRKAIAATGAFEPEIFKEDLTRIAADEHQLPTVRVDALEAVSRQRKHLSDGAFELLVLLVDQAAELPPINNRDFRPFRERARAVQFLSSANLSSQQLLALSKHLQSAGPLELRQLIKPYQRDRTEAVGRAFLESIGKARSLMSLEPVEISEVVKRYPEELLTKANNILDRLKQRDQEKRERLDKLLATIDSGDTERGRKLFFSEKAKCSSCHRVRFEGSRVGPDLTRIGRIRQPQDLLEAIVFPSASFVREYEPYTLVTDEGRILTGLIVAETSAIVVFQPQTGEAIRIPRESIEKLVPSTVSIMPKGLDEALDEQQLADIVAYLRSLK